MSDKILKTYIKDETYFDEYGNFHVEAKKSDCIGKYFDFGDIISFRFLNYDIKVPVVNSYKVGEIAKPQLVFLNEQEDPYAFLGLIYIGSISEMFHLASQYDDINEPQAWKINDKIKFPIEVEMELYEKGGFLETMELRRIDRKYNREDYPHLNDEDYANFRQVKTTGMGNNLFRGSTPIEPRLNRQKYVDQLLNKYKIKNIINLSNIEEELGTHKYYHESYYKDQNILALGLNVDMNSRRYQNGIKKALEFIINNDGPYYIHCVEGQDRTGFLCGILEMLMGANFKEIVEDYMRTFYNYYGITKDDERYPYFSSDMIQVYENIFYTEPLFDKDLQFLSKNYLIEIGLTEEDVDKLKEKLAK